MLYITQEYPQKDANLCKLRCDNQLNKYQKSVRPKLKTPNNNTRNKVPEKPLYHYAMMPFGLCNAAKRLCRLTDRIVPKAFVLVFRQKQSPIKHVWTRTEPRDRAWKRFSFKLPSQLLSICCIYDLSTAKHYEYWVTDTVLGSASVNFVEIFAVSVKADIEKKCKHIFII